VHRAVLVLWLVSGVILAERCVVFNPLLGIYGELLMWKMQTPVSLIQEDKAMIQLPNTFNTIRGEVNNCPQCSCICVSVGSTVVLCSIAMRGFLVIISAQV
jgi:hypothetical protein